MDVLILVILFIIFIATIYLFLRNTPTIIGGDEQIMYHGSINKIDNLEPRFHQLTNSKVIFGTPSYADAVIFSAAASDYDTAMWGDGKHRYIEEQYPNAFDTLKKTGYVHYLKGNFRPLGSGLSNEYVADHAIKPYRIDTVNIYDYLKKSDVIMRTFEEMLAARKTAKQYVPSQQEANRIICCISMADEYQFDAKSFVTTLGLPIVLIHSWDFNIKDTEYYIFVGNPVLGNDHFNIPREKIYLKHDLAQLVADYAMQPRRTTPANYLKFLENKQNLYHDYYWIPESRTMDHIRNVIWPQMLIRERYPDTILTHITGPSGSGKTTIYNKLKAILPSVVDTDDITDRVGENDFKAIYAEIDTLMQNKEVILCGLSINLSYLANRKYMLDVPPETIYKQLINRTLHGICDNLGSITFTGNTLDELSEEYEALQTKFQIRNPGFIPPRIHLFNAVLPMINHHLQTGYKLISPQLLVDELTQK